MFVISLVIRLIVPVKDTCVAMSIRNKNASPISPSPPHSPPPELSNQIVDINVALQTPLAVTPPPVCLDANGIAVLVQAAAAYVAKMSVEHPGRYGYFVYKHGTVALAADVGNLPVPATIMANDSNANHRRVNVTRNELAFSMNGEESEYDVVSFRNKWSDPWTFSVVLPGGSAENELLVAASWAYNADCGDLAGISPSMMEVVVRENGTSARGAVEGSVDVEDTPHDESDDVRRCVLL
jgi:hypothetical protein